LHRSVGTCCEWATQSVQSNRPSVV
jgi:hypothetical protein